MNRWMTVAEAADELAVSTKSIRRWIAAGRLPAQRVGPRLVRIDRKDIGAVLEPASR